MLLCPTSSFVHAVLSAGLVPLTLKFQFSLRYTSITLNWLVILLSLLNSTTYVYCF